MASPAGPPYPPVGALLGGIPASKLNTPISGVLIALFLIAAITHITIFERNRILRKRRFLPSIMCFWVCMLRTVALSLRIAWSRQQTNITLAIVVNVFTAAGVVILFVANLVLTHKIVRATLGTRWPGLVRPARVLLKVLIASVIGMLIALIAATVRSFFTLDTGIRQQCRDVQLVGTTWLALMAFLPIPILLVTLLLSRKRPVKDFGHGSMFKILLVLFTATILALGAGFRTGVAFDARMTPDWFHSTACYYCFNYVIEIVVLYLYAITRFDRRFWEDKPAAVPEERGSDGSV